MKVAVITRHAITNYGSLLQAFATQQIVESMGHSCEIIDYVRVDESYMQHEKTLLARKHEWNRNPIKKMLYLALRLPESIAAGRKFEKEQGKYLHLTKRYSSQEQLVHDKPIADVYMTGSDQVWGPVANGDFDSSYCLSFTDYADKKISYAASFGRTEMTADAKAYFRKWLSRYNCICVRESSAVRIIEEMGLKASQVIDPTLLLDASFWAGIASPIKKQDYVLVYQLHNDKRVGEYAKKVAETMGLPLIRISTSFHQITREGKFIWCPTIGEFLGYIQNARCMITDSFHGTAFAINFNTQFVEILPNNKTGTRNISILQLTGLADRILKDCEDVALAHKKIDFSQVNQIITNEREKSISVLQQMLEA